MRKVLLNKCVFNFFFHSTSSNGFHINIYNIYINIICICIYIYIYNIYIYIYKFEGHFMMCCEKKFWKHIYSIKYDIYIIYIYIYIYKMCVQNSMQRW